MSDDIKIQKTIRRLTRRYNAPGHELVNDDGPDAVAIIEALQAEVERLKGVLEEIKRLSRLEDSVRISAINQLTDKALKAKP